MDVLQDPALISPNLVYLMLMLGLWLGATGTYIPGTGVVEIAGALLIVGTLYLMTLMATNWIALLLLVVGASLFFLLPLLKPELIRIAEAGLVARRRRRSSLFWSSAGGSASATGAEVNTHAGPFHVKEG